MSSQQIAAAPESVLTAHGRHNSSTLSPKARHATRNGLICAVTVVACMWATYPIEQMGFIDDWSYAKTAQVFALTDHFVYNGWATAMLGWQVVWGALFIKIFGFSFTVVRLSTLPVAVATIILFHAVLVRFGINSRNAVLGTLALGLSPMFIPLAVSYMTDVPGLFVVILCLYLCQRAVDAKTNKATIAWLCMAAASNVVGGTARQIAWLGALVMVPSTGWLLCKRRGVLLTTSLLWVSSLISVLACMRWFARQPYSIPESVLDGVSLHHIGLWLRAFWNLLGAALCLLLLIFPIATAWLPQLRTLKRAALMRIACITLVWSLFQVATKWMMPWLFHVIQSEFSNGHAGEMSSFSDMKFLGIPTWVQQAMSLLVVATGLVFLESVGSRLWLLIKTKTEHLTSWRDFFWLLAPFTLSYFVMLMPRAFHISIFDRYLLLIMPVAIICLLILHQEWITETLPPVSIVAIVTFALLAIAGTHDWFAWYRARVVAIEELRASGMSRTEIQAGFEYDGWTQVKDGGYINEPRLKVPAGAYHPDNHPEQVADECKLNFAPDTPLVHPKFTTAFQKMWCLAPSKYPPVIYRTWLPPYGRAIYVQEIPDSSH